MRSSLSHTLPKSATLLWVRHCILGDCLENTPFWGVQSVTTTEVSPHTHMRPTWLACKRLEITATDVYGMSAYKISKEDIKGVLARSLDEISVEALYKRSVCKISIRGLWGKISVQALYKKPPGQDLCTRSPWLSKWASRQSETDLTRTKCPEVSARDLKMSPAPQLEQSDRPKVPRGLRERPQNEHRATAVPPWMNTRP